MGLRRKYFSHPTRRLRKVPVLPALFTLLNGVCGFASIHFAARGMNEQWFEKPQLTFFAASAYMIFLGMIADALDGRLARMSRTTSSFGGQLDSLSDMVNFGVAPAFLMLRLVESGLKNIVGSVNPAFGSISGKLLWLIAAMYVCCAALRLARFNVENEPDEASHLAFEGLPTPAAAGIIAALVLLHSDLGVELQRGMAPNLAKTGSLIILYMLPLATIAGSLLMVSRIRYVHLVNYYIRGRRPFGHIVLLVGILLLLIWQLQLTLAAVGLAYGASGLSLGLWRKYFRKTKAPPEISSDPAEEKNKIY